MKALWFLNSGLSGCVATRSATFATKGDEQRALDAGCDGYIAKPVDTRTLPAQLVEFLTRAGCDNSGKPS